MIVGDWKESVYFFLRGHRDRELKINGERDRLPCCSTPRVACKRSDDQYLKRTTVLLH
jgi:hypothetical protein